MRNYVLQSLQGHSEVDQFFIVFLKILNLEEFLMSLGTTDHIFGAR